MFLDKKRLYNDYFICLKEKECFKKNKEADMATNEEINIKKAWEEYQSAKVAQEDRQEQGAPKSEASFIAGAIKTVAGGFIFMKSASGLYTEYKQGRANKLEFENYKKLIQERFSIAQSDAVAYSNAMKEFQSAEVAYEKVKKLKEQVKTLESQIADLEKLSGSRNKPFELGRNWPKDKQKVLDDALNKKVTVNGKQMTLGEHLGVEKIPASGKKGAGFVYRLPASDAAKEFIGLNMRNDGKPGLLTNPRKKISEEVIKNFEIAEESINRELTEGKAKLTGVKKKLKELSSIEEDYKTKKAVFEHARKKYSESHRNLTLAEENPPKGVTVEKVSRPEGVSDSIPRERVVKGSKPKIGFKGYAGRGLKVLGVAGGLALGYWGVSEMAKASIDSFNAAFHPNGASRSEAVDDKSKAASGTLSPAEQKYFSDPEYLNKCFSVLIYASKNGLAGISKEDWIKYQQEFLTASDPKQIDLRKALVAEYDANKAKYKAVAAEHDKQAKKADITPTQVARGLHVLQYLAENGGAIKGGKYVKQGLPVEQYQAILEQINDQTADPLEVAELLKLLAEGYDNKANGFIRDWEPSNAQEGDGVSVETGGKTPETEKDNSKEKPEAESEYIEGDLDNLDDILGFSTQNTPANTSRALRGAGSEVLEDNGPQVRSRSSGRGGMA